MARVTCNLRTSFSRNSGAASKFFLKDPTYALQIQNQPSRPTRSTNDPLLCHANNTAHLKFSLIKCMLKHILHVSRYIKLRVCIKTQMSYMGGLKTTKHNVLDLNHYRVGSRTHTNCTLKALHQNRKDAQLCHQYILLRFSET